MSKSRHSEVQMIGEPKQVESGPKVEDVAAGEKARFALARGRAAKSVIVPGQAPNRS